MPKASVHRSLNVASPDAVAQCQKCFAVFSIDLVDSVLGVPMVHKDANDPRYVDNPCDGRVKLFQEVR